MGFSALIFQHDDRCSFVSRCLPFYQHSQPTSTYSIMAAAPTAATSPKTLELTLPAAPITGVIGEVAAAPALVVRKPDDAGGTTGAVPLGTTMGREEPVGKGAPEAGPERTGTLGEAAVEEAPEPPPGAADEIGALDEAAAEEAPEPPPGAADEAIAAADAVGELGAAPPPTVTVW